MSYCQELGTNVKWLRKKAGLSQEQLALEAGISNSYYRLIEHGAANPTIQELEKIARVLDVSLADLLITSASAGAAI